MLVSNTSTLVLLAKVGCLETFMGISSIIIIPEEVKREALFEKESYYARLIEKLIQEKKIQIIPANKKEITTIMTSFRLDEGEAAAYVLFDQKKHKAILTDDGELIKLCKLEKVPFMCAMAIVIRLYEKKKITKEKTFKILEQLHTIGRYKQAIYENFKAQVN